MDNHHDALMGQLQAFTLDQVGAGLSFTQRLARENGWPVAFAEQVVAEYRRFLYLAVRAGHPVTPSKAVDQAWHLHLVYTDSYWNNLCRQVLGRPLHHGPTRGGRDEAEKFVDWYERTLASYRRIFGSHRMITITDDEPGRLVRLPGAADIAQIAALAPFERRVLARIHGDISASTLTPSLEADAR